MNDTFLPCSRFALGSMLALAMTGCSAVTTEKHADFAARPADHPIVVYESMQELPNRPHRRVGRLQEKVSEASFPFGIFERRGLEEMKCKARQLGADALVFDREAKVVQVETPPTQVPLPVGTHKGQSVMMPVNMAGSVSHVTYRSVAAIRWLDGNEVPVTGPSPASGSPPTSEASRGLLPTPIAVTTPEPGAPR